MAAPVVSGLALLMYQQDARVTPDQVKMRLEATAEHWPGDLLGAGAGYVNATRALQSRLDGVVAAVSPTVVDNGDGTFHLAGTLTGTSVLWSDESLCGDIVLWGDPSRRSSSVLWGDSVLWGNAADWAARVYGPDTGGNIVWGDVFRRQTSVLWGDAGPAADSAWPVEGSSILAYGD
jgi:hypothetical protein